MIKILPLLLFPLLLHAESYTFSGGKDNVAHTIASRVIIKAYKNAGINITPVFLNLEESLRQSNAGITDGEIARIATITRLYPNLRKVPVSTMSVEAIAFSKNTSLDIKTWNDLKGHNLTIVKGAKFIETGTKDLDQNYVANINDALELLQADKTDIIVLPKLAGINLIYSKKYHQIKAVSHSLKTLKLYHFVHKKNAHLIPIITPILKEMQRSGEIAFIKKTHLLKATKKFSSENN